MVELIRLDTKLNNELQNILKLKDFVQFKL